MMTFNDFVHKNKLKNKTTSNRKIYQVVLIIGLGNVDKFLRNGSFSSGVGKVNLHLSGGTHSDAFINEKFFDIMVAHFLKNI